MNVNFKKLFMTGFLSLSLLGGVLISTNSNAAIEVNAAGEQLIIDGPSAGLGSGYKTVTKTIGGFDIAFTDCFSDDNGIQIDDYNGDNTGTNYNGIHNVTPITNITSIVVEWSIEPSDGAFYIHEGSSVNPTTEPLIATGNGPYTYAFSGENYFKLSMGEDRYGKLKSLTINYSNVEAIPPTSVNVTPTTHIMYVGETKQFSAFILPVEANQEVIWEIDVTSTGSGNIDDNGLFVATGAGDIMVEAKAKDDQTIVGNSLVEILPNAVTEFTYTGSPTVQSAGNNFDSTGLTFNATRQNGLQELNIEHSKITFSPDILSLSDTSVTASYEGLTTEITDVNVGIVASDEIVITPSVMPTSYANNSTIEVNDLSLKIDDVGTFDGKKTIQFKSGSGYISNTAALSGIKEIKLVANDEAELSYVDVYSGSATNLKTTKITGVTTSNTKTFEFNADEYFTIAGGSGTANLTAIHITYSVPVAQGISDLVKYIGEFDDNGQCNDRFPIAKTMFLALTADDQNTFRTSTDTTIAAARERYVAWATHLNQNPWVEGEALNTITSNAMNSMNAVIIIISLSLASVSVIGGYYFVQKKQKQD